MRHYRNQMMRPARTRSLALDVMKGAAINEISRRQRAAAEQPQANRMMEALRSAGGNLNVPGATSPQEVQNLYQMQTNVEKSQQAEKDRILKETAGAVTQSVNTGDETFIDNVIRKYGITIGQPTYDAIDATNKKFKAQAGKSGGELLKQAMEIAPASLRVLKKLNLPGINPDTGQPYSTLETDNITKQRTALNKLDIQKKKILKVSTEGEKRKNKKKDQVWLATYKQNLKDFGDQGKAIEQADKAVQKMIEAKSQTQPIAKLPKGAVQIGTSGGKPVFQTPDGNKFIGE